MNSKEKNSLLDKVNEQFQTRGKYNEGRYINRSFYEEAYEDAFRKNKCIVIKGNSGCGKTWLTLHMLESKKKKYTVVDLAQVQEGLIDHFKYLLKKVHTGYHDEKTAEIGLSKSGAGLGHVDDYELNVNYYLQYLSKHEGEFIILDNLENVINDTEMLKQIGKLLTMTDSMEVLENKSRLIIIGTNSDVLKILREVIGYETISNRLYEVTEIKGFTKTECYDFISQRFKEAGIKLNDGTIFSNMIYECTEGTPQHVSDLCLLIGEEFIRDGKKTIGCASTEEQTLIEQAKMRWIRTSFLTEYAKISSLYACDGLNREKQKNYNMVLYSVINCQERSFDRDLIHAKVGEFFQEQASQISKKFVGDYLRKLSDSTKSGNILVEKNNGKYGIKSTKTLHCMKLVIFIKDGLPMLLDCDEIGDAV